MEDGGKTIKPIRIIACGVFRPALEHLQLEKIEPTLQLTYLPSNLHLRPQELENYLLQEIIAAKKRGERIICLYGHCFPDIDDFCKRHGAIKVAGHHCYEMLLGSEQFRQLIDETAGTYFAEKDLILNFDEYCKQPLELYDDEIRKYFFKNYKKLLYVRQPLDPDLILKLDELTKFLDLALEIRDADYSHLERNLTDLI